MESAPILEFEALLSPIPGDNPAGVYLREADRAAYDAIRRGCGNARSAESKATPDEGGAALAGMSEWRTVKPAAIKALTEKTKDLEICAYLIEAMLRLHGAAGLRDGFRLAREIAETFWDNVYPLPEEEDLSPRVQILGGLNGDSETVGTLPPAIGNMILAEPPGADPIYFTTYHDAVGKARKDPEGGDYLEPLRTALRMIDLNSLRVLAGDIEAARKEVVALSDLLDQKCGRDAPGFGAIRQELERCQDGLNELAGERMRAAEESESSTETTGEEGEATATTGGGGGGKGGGPVRGREDALKSLLEIATFFDRTEPHSVIPYALRQVVRWGRLSLPELLAELIADDTSRSALYKQVGIQTPDESS